MAVPFVPAVSLSQSASGGIVTITDESPYSTNTDGVTLENIGARLDNVYDGLGNLIQAITFTPGQLTATLDIAKDYYLNNQLAFTLANSSVVTGVDNYLAANYYNNAAREVSRKLRCCNCHHLCNNAVKADLAYNEAVTATLFNVPSEAQNAIDDANSLINEEECSC